MRLDCAGYVYSLLTVMFLSAFCVCSLRLLPSRRYPRRNAHSCVLYTSLSQLSWQEIREIPNPGRDLPESLSHLVSSPKLYAAALNLTQSQIKQQQDDFDNKHRILQEVIADRNRTNVEKQDAVCKFRYQYGRKPFVCPSCWSYLPICICQRWKHLQENEPPSTRSNPLNPMVQVVFYTHSEEWQRTSNTGSVVAMALNTRPNDHGTTICQAPAAQLLLKGLISHEEQLDSLLQDSNNLPVLLWPRNEQKQYEPDKTPTYVDTDEIRDWLHGPAQNVTDSVTDELFSSKRRVVLIALDGTWRNARRMVHRFGLDIPRMQVAPTKAQSILAPLRQQGPHPVAKHAVVNKNQCTAEAVVAALVGIQAISTEHGQQILDLVQAKVDLTVKYRGKREV